MPLTVNYRVSEVEPITFPFRLFISGSSQSGKTTFALNLLQSIEQHVDHIQYYHPDYLSDLPMSWHETLATSISYRAGLPNMDELCSLQPKTVLVIDDLYEESVRSQAIDYLFRVLSGKRNLSVIIMSQRYFGSGKYAMNIRNNVNYLTLMRNVDATLNARVARMLNLTGAIQNAVKNFHQSYWPYMFIDLTPKSQVSRCQVYTDLFNRYKVIYTSDGMKTFLISEADFLTHFSIINNYTAACHNERSRSALSETERERQAIGRGRANMGRSPNRGRSSKTPEPSTSAITAKEETGSTSSTELTSITEKSVGGAQGKKEETRAGNGNQANSSQPRSTGTGGGGGASSTSSFDGTSGSSTAFPSSTGSARISHGASKRERQRQKYRERRQRYRAAIY